PRVINEIRTEYQKQFGPNLVFVTKVDQSLQNLRKRQRQGDLDARAAIENFRAVSSPVVNSFSQFGAAFEGRLSRSEALAARMEEPLAKARKITAMVRQRLADPKPLDDSDAKLIQLLGDASG